mmetsp:Transcript_24192/g.36793  ORF Transcript_24192/g.36793 Transcript_24192/m.36793 type:complete len:113 (+) Transcript_24192:907-1245(+)
MGQFQEARPLYDEAFQGFWDIYGAKHPTTLAAIYNMGEWHSAQEEWGPARKFYEEALEGRGETLGKDHPDTIANMEQLGELLENMGKIDEARLMRAEFEREQPTYTAGFFSS